MSVSTVYNVVWLFFVLAGLLSSNLISGLLSMTLAGKKGYTGYFWTGFLLGLAGLIYVAGLPDNRPHAR